MPWKGKQATTWNNTMHAFNPGFASIPVIGRADLRLSGVLSSPKMQGNSDACTSFAITGAVEAAVRKKLLAPVTLAPWFIHTCVLGVAPNQGASIDYVIPRVMTSGIALTTDTNAPIPQSQCAVQQLYKVSNWFRIDNGQAAKAALDQGDVVVCTLIIDWERFVHLAPNEVYAYPPGDQPASHTVCLVGYDDQAGYWIIENSQGSGWSYQGFGKIAYDTCDMFDSASTGYGATFTM
jgi:hypothetical protein